MGELKAFRKPLMPQRRPRLSTTIDPDHDKFIREMATRHRRDHSVVVDQLLTDGRRYWDLSEKQKKELGRELGALREAQKETRAMLEQMSRWITLLLAQQNLSAASTMPGGPIGSGDRPATFADWQNSIHRIANEIGKDN